MSEDKTETDLEAIEEEGADIGGADTEDVDLNDVRPVEVGSGGGPENDPGDAKVPIALASKEYSSTVEKGTEFEVQVAELFKSYGYLVSHNVTLKGKKSGVVHQIDVLVEYDGPLHKTKMIVEAKAYSHNVVKDIIMKLENIRDDLGIEGAVLATTAEFTSGAQQTAEQYPLVDLWNGDKINELMANKGIDTSETGILGAEKRFVVSKVNQKSIRKSADKSAKKRSGGALFGRGRPKEKVVSMELVCYPYLDVSVQTRVSKVEKTGWRKREPVVRTVVHHVTLDGRTGALVTFTKKGISYRYSYLGVTDKDEMSILRQAAGKPTFGKNEMVLAELSPSAANAAIVKLVSNGVVKQVSEKPVKYSLVAPVPKTPAALVGIDKVYGNNMLDAAPGNRVIGMAVSIGSMEEKLGKVWPGCRVISTEQTYYPYFDVRYEDTDGGSRNEMIDGRTGKPQKYLAEVMAEGVE